MWPYTRRAGVFERRRQKRILIDADGDGFTHVVTGAAVTSVDFTLPAARAQAKRVIVQYEIILDGAPVYTYYFRPNALTTNISCLNRNWSRAFVNVSISATTEFLTGLVGDANTDLLKGELQFDLHETGGLHRRFRSESTTSSSTPLNERVNECDGSWFASTELTSLRLTADLASQIKVGSKFKVFLEFDV